MPHKKIPCTYVGLPLHVKQVRRVDIQPLIDKVGKRLQAWKGTLLNRAGRLKLVNSVLTSIPTYYLTVFRLQKWALKKINKLRRSFLWKGTAEVRGGHCLVNWSKTMRPKCFGSLGILDLDLFCRALHLRWLWFEWTSPERPWVGTERRSMLLIDNYFEQAPLSLLEMELRPVSGNHHGCKGRHRWTCFLSFSS